MKRKNDKNKEQLSQIKLIDNIINATRNKSFSADSIKSAKPFIRALAKRIRVSDEAAMIFAAFFDSFSDPRINFCDIAMFYDSTQVKILTYWSAVDELVKHKLLNQFRDNDGEMHFSIPGDVVDAVRTDSVYTPKDYKDLTIDQWVGELNNVITKKKHDCISFEDFKETLMLLVRNNQHLTIAYELANIHDFQDLIVMVAMLNLYIQNNDDRIIKSDIEDIFEFRWEMRPHARRLEHGTHSLQKEGLVEYSDCGGLAEMDTWKLTNNAKSRFLPEIDTNTSVITDRNIRSANSISPKQLFFNPSVTKQLLQLESLLHPDRFQAVQDNLAKHGMRRGFACIFYGGPGTGKTESVLQLARKTGRGIMIVDIPNLRDKYVGETEKNVKTFFERYRNYCSRAEIAPILFINEADAILCKRNEGAVNSVDKMENAMQNIILQEMETLDGILIATTNLTGNLDDAFERRFLYKIEFPKPSPNESQHIWHSMLPEISEQEAYDLAKQYSFSGGQIENIARKQIVNAVLSGDDKVKMDAVREACKTELLNRPGTRRIGFC